MFDINAFAENLRKQRLHIGLKQYELADMLHITPQSISKWEQGISVPDLQNLCALSEIFGISIDALVSHENAKEKLLLAIDGGGTKTEFVLFSVKGNIKQRIVLEGSNPNVYGMDKACDTLKRGIDSLMSPENEIVFIYCGVAGFLSGDNGEKISRFLQNTYPKIKIRCGGDILNVAASATTDDNCIAVICGTGSNVSAIMGNELVRVGGWGYLFDDALCGFSLGKSAITAALAQNDGVGEKTIMTELIEKRLGMSVWDAIGKIYAEDKAYIASFASVVFEAYAKGDKLAEKVIGANVKALTDKINVLAEKYDCGSAVVISGGIMKQKDILLPFIQYHLTKNKQIVVPKLPQIYGACVLCCKHSGVNIPNFQEIFTADYPKFVNGGFE